jgi:hypothetical protein
MADEIFAALSVGVKFDKKSKDEFEKLEKKHLKQEEERGHGAYV